MKRRNLATAVNPPQQKEGGRGERIRTSDSCVPNAVLYQAELRPDGKMVARKTHAGTGSKT